MTSMWRPSQARGVSCKYEGAKDKRQETRHETRDTIKVLGGGFTWSEVVVVVMVVAEIIVVMVMVMVMIVVVVD
jgi:hypothetical protein